MKVSELIAALAQMPQDLEVRIYAGECNESVSFLAPETVEVYDEYPPERATVDINCKDFY
jgi:hypothetical protein